MRVPGAVIWGRIESNGQLEVSNQSHGNPSKAFQAATGKPRQRVVLLALPRRERRMAEDRCAPQ